MSGPTIDEYNSRIPNANDFLAVSQGNFLDNFQQLYDAFATNHVALDDSILTPGNHTFIELLQQGKGPATQFGEISLYSKLVEGQTNQLFLRYQGGQAPDVQLTAYQIYPAQNLPWQISYFTFLPGNVIVYFGISIPESSPEGNAVNFPPYVMKNVIASAFCAQATIPTLSPTITLNKDHLGNISSASLFNLTAGYSYFYIMIGNM